jgi:glycerol-3-phosphate dehydrogenase
LSHRKKKEKKDVILFCPKKTILQLVGRADMSLEQWKDNINVDFNEVKYVIADWIQLSYDKIYFRLL